MARKKRKNTEIDREPVGEHDGDTDSADAGQAGDLQGLSDEAEASSESVRELAEEGQAFEAGIVSGIENAPDADVSEVRTREVPEDDVPSEYTDKDPDEPQE